MFGISRISKIHWNWHPRCWSWKHWHDTTGHGEGEILVIIIAGPLVLHLRTGVEHSNHEGLSYREQIRRHKESRP